MVWRFLFVGVFVRAGLSRAATACGRSFVLGFHAHTLSRQHGNSKTEAKGEVMNEVTTFAVGDIVRLKSGGPAMTVDGVRADGVFNVVWFDECQVCRDVFLPSDLIWAMAVEWSEMFQMSACDGKLYRLMPGGMGWTEVSQ